MMVNIVYHQLCCPKFILKICSKVHSTSHVLQFGLFCKQLRKLPICNDTVADSGGAPGGPGPPLWESLKMWKGPINGKWMVLPPPHWIAPTSGGQGKGKILLLPPHWIASGFGDHGKILLLPPPLTPPTESRRLGTSHERGPLFMKILDLRLWYTYFSLLIAMNLHTLYIVCPLA